MMPMYIDIFIYVVASIETISGSGGSTAEIHRVAEVVWSFGISIWGDKEITDRIDEEIVGFLVGYDGEWE